MGYPRELDEYSEREFQAEFARRVQCREQHLCYYCKQPLDNGKGCKLHVHKKPRPGTADEFANTKRVAEYVSEELKRVVDPFIDAMDEDAPDERNRPLVLGTLIGVRYFTGQHAGLESVLRPMLEEIGIPSANYDRMCASSDILGKAVAEVIAETMPEEG